MRSTRLVPIVFLLLLMVVANVPCQAADEAAEDLFVQGNEAYGRGDFPDAIAKYQEVLARAGFSSSVLFNLANAHAELGQIGQAVLHYERARRLTPGDADIVGNLELLRREKGLFAGEHGGIERFFDLESLDKWALLALFGLLGSTAVVAVSLRAKFSQKALMATVIAGCAVMVLGVVGAGMAYRHFHSAVVTGSDARLLLSPFAGAASVGAIPEGRLVYPEKCHGEFLYVTDDTYRQGWLRQESLTAVVETRPGLCPSSPERR